jgi:predicted DNA-binding protein
MYLRSVAMPMSLRLPLPVEAQIMGLSLRSGLSKSALIVKSIEEYLSRHAQPSAYDIYQEVMQESAGKAGAAHAPEQRAHKRAVRDAVRAKQAMRSSAASKAVALRKTI